MRNMLTILEVIQNNDGMFSILDSMAGATGKVSLPGIADILSRMKCIKFRVIDPSDVTSYSYEDYGVNTWRVISINLGSESILVVSDTFDGELDSAFRNGGSLFNGIPDIDRVIMELMRDKANIELDLFNIEILDRSEKLKSLIEGDIKIHVTELSPFYKLIVNQAKIALAMVASVKTSSSKKVEYLRALNEDMNKILSTYKNLKSNLYIDYDGDEDQVEKLMDDIIILTSIIPIEEDKEDLGAI